MTVDDSMRARGRRDAGTRWLLLPIIGLALALRLWNLSFGLPRWYHPDEPRKARVVARMALGNSDPEYFYHPSFLLYASAGVLRILHVAGTSINAVNAAWAGRVVSAVLGAATVALVFCLCGAVASPSAALLAALLLAVAPLHVVCSHYLKEDAALAFWGTALCLAALRLGERGTRGDALCAGLLAGVATGTKYTGVLFLLLPWLASRQRASGGRQTGFRPVLAAAVVGFLLTTPWAVRAPLRFTRGVGHEILLSAGGMGGIAHWPLRDLWTYHLRFSLLPGLGWPAAMLAAWGFILCLRRGDTASRLLGVAVFGLYSIFENSPLKPPPNADRYVLPMLPFLAVLAAMAWDDLRLRVKRRNGWGRAGVVVVALLACAWPLVDSVRLDAAMVHDTRAAARQWLLENACGHGAILIEGALDSGGRRVVAYGPRLPARCRPTYVNSLAHEGRILNAHRFVVASSFTYDRYLHLAAAPPAARAFYRRFFAAHRPVAEFRPRVRSYGFHNPTIRVYDLLGTGSAQGDGRSYRTPRSRRTGVAAAGGAGI